MATNEPMVAEVNELEQFDRVATQILNTFEPLIHQLIARRDALLRELEDMKENYLTKESTRKAAREELLATQLHLRELSLKINENKQYTNRQLTSTKNGSNSLRLPLNSRYPSCPVRH